MSDPDVIVIGAGFAGLVAAVRIANAGRRVLVLEARTRLGGRATAFDDRETGERVDNGQHVLFGCYTETLSFLRAIGMSDAVRVQEQLAITMIDRAGRPSRLVCPVLPPPLHLLAGVLEWDALGWRDRFSALKLAPVIGLARRALGRGANVQAAAPGETVDRWLERNGQTPRICEMLWHPLALAALNQPADVAGARPFARVLAEMFTSDRRAAAIALPTRPLDQMYAEPARTWLERHGAEVRTGTSARVVIGGGAIERVEAGSQSWRPRAVVSAVPWFAFPGLVTGDTAPLARIVQNAQTMDSSPIVTVNAWLDRQIIDEPFVGLPGRAMQWVFDKRDAFGPEASHLSLVSSGASEIASMRNDELIGLAQGELIDAIPRMRGALVRRATVVREPRATFSLAPGQPPRPSLRTPVSGFFLAGDWTDTGLPATIESAVRSGNRAAGIVLSTLGAGR